MTDAELKADMERLMALPEFRRFMWRAIQTARIFDPTTDGSEGRHLAYHEGRRNLGLELLAECERGQPVPYDPARPSILSTIQILREEAQQQLSEKGKDRQRYDRTAEISDPDA